MLCLILYPRFLPAKVCYKCLLTPGWKWKYENAQNIRVFSSACILTQRMPNGSVNEFCRNVIGKDQSSDNGKSMLHADYCIPNWERVRICRNSCIRIVYHQSFWRVASCTLKQTFSLVLGCAKVWPSLGMTLKTFRCMIAVGCRSGNLLSVSADYNRKGARIFGFEKALDITYAKRKKRGRFFFLIYGLQKPQSSYYWSTQTVQIMRMSIGRYRDWWCYC